MNSYLIVVPWSERKIIEAALAETPGPGFPTIRAATIGVPPSTLDHRIKSLKNHKKTVRVPLKC